jgi:hypothetical protein
MSAEFTKGPWDWQEQRFGECRIVARGDVLAMLETSGVEGFANARLIAAAPELYEALATEETRLAEEYLDLCADIQEGGDHRQHLPRIQEIEKAIAALRKARGDA